jgi:NAD(P)-dependent dehydrogenase (short-subunit alcohol dehydrogenase family)
VNEKERSVPTFDEGAAAVITGAGQGIGRGVALALAERGVHVLVNDVNEAAARAVAAEVQLLGAKAAVSTQPVGSMDSGEVIVDAAMDAFGRVDILFNNAGIFRPENFWEITDKAFEDLMDVNFRGVFSLMRAATSKWMVPNRRGKIINITSRVAFRGKNREAVYAASKMAVVGMTISASIDLMPYGINVNALSPAAWTAMAEAQPEPVREAMRASRAACVLGRVGEVQDVVPAVLFLASRDSDYLTGQVIQATGQPMGLL